jgi:hypothetical protein
MNEIDLKLHLLGGDSIEVDNLVITPYKLKEIKKYGYSNYMKNLQWISVSVDDFISSVLDIEKRMYLESMKSELKAYDFYIKLGGQDLLDSLLQTLKMIFKTDDVRVLDESVIAIDFVKKGIMIELEDGRITVDEEKIDSLGEEEIMLVHRENFDSIVNVVKLQNYLEKPSSAKSDSENPADEETRKLMEHMKKLREKVEAKKKRQKDDDGEDIDISDIISAVSSKSNSINKLNIWELTLYQLYDEYARLELIDNYDFSIKAMMAGADKVDLKHWSSKL